MAGTNGGTPREQGPPPAWGIDWEYRALWQTERGPRHVWWGRHDSERYAEALRAHPTLRDHGFAREFIGSASHRPVFWEVPGYDRAAVAEECRHAVEVAVPAMRAAVRAAAEAKKAAAAAAAEELRTRPARAVAAANESLALTPWAWARQSDVDAARGWLAAPERIDGMHAAMLLTMVSRAADNVTRAREALAIPFEPELALARVPGVAAAALRACRLLTERDADRASEWNRAGWGKTTTLRGHLLAAMEALDEAATTHALRALRRHRRQLPPELDAAVFGRAAALAAA